MRISAIIPTYKREQVLCDTVRLLLGCSPRPDEIIVVDQTDEHEPETVSRLTEWSRNGDIIWMRIDEKEASQPHAMNAGAVRASGEIVLFLDDDIVPAGDLIAGHREAHEANPEAWAVVGQVIQPWQTAEDRVFAGRRFGLWAYLCFPFNSTRAAWINNAMTGNLSVLRHRFLEAGGFDENFVPPVSHRCESEFVRRLTRAGGGVLFYPLAGLRHLAAARGGTRSRGGNLANASPACGVGDYYFALCSGRGWEIVLYWAFRLFRQCRTKYLLSHPWLIPVKFIGEVRAMALALKLRRQGPIYIDGGDGRSS